MIKWRGIDDGMGRNFMMIWRQNSNNDDMERNYDNDIGEI